MKNNNDNDNDIEQALLSVDNDEDNNVTRSCGNKVPAYGLTAIGCASEGAQALFALTEFFGVSNIIGIFKHVKSNEALKLLMLGYIVSGTLATSIQSCYLEFPYTFDLFDDPCKLFSQPANKTLHLNPAELAILATVAFLGAMVRGIVSTMGYYAIADRSTPLITTLIVASAVCDVIQTIATDGTFLKKMYMWLRSDKNNLQVQADLQAFFEDNDSEENPACNTWDSQYVYYTCIALASLSVMGEAGLGLIAMKQGAELLDFNNQSTGFFIGAVPLSICYFLLMSAIDTASPAKIITRYYEQYSLSTPNNSKIPSHITFAASVLCLIGASVKALGTYSGTQFLLTPRDLQDSNAVITIKTISVIIGLIRAVQCLLVEGIATFAQIEKNYSGYQPLPNQQPTCCAWQGLCSWQSTVVGSVRNDSADYVDRPSDMVGLVSANNATNM